MLALGPMQQLICVEALWNSGLLYQHSRNSHCLGNIVVSHDELMYVWDKTHATNNIVIMTKLILQCGGCGILPSSVAATLQ